jgi:hypothetical protein
MYKNLKKLIYYFILFVVYPIIFINLLHLTEAVWRYLI